MSMIYSDDNGKTFTILGETSDSKVVFTAENFKEWLKELEQREDVIIIDL